jgi:hypothetical protein
MSQLKRFVALLFLSLCVAGCVVYEPVPVTPSNPMAQPWQAAMGAMQDTGLAIVTADQATGLVRGTRGSAVGEIRVAMRADGRVGVEITSQNDPTLTQRLTDAYNRRMGR